MWWRMWKGHVFLAATTILFIGTTACLAVVLLTDNFEVAFYAYIIGVLAFLAGLVLGIIASHTMKSKADRGYMRQESRRPLASLEAPGRAQKRPGSTYPRPSRKPVSPAYSPSEEASDGR